ncbi:hypothetical protein AB0O62_25645 [Streptomyces sp. NPDC086779]|uniref:hypothetical protein n=1 Tax=Streptomyces sp. NPDC086779 TaxID=3156670 RepID=UPI0034304F19
MSPSASTRRSATLHTAPAPGPALRQYADEIKDVRVLYFITALRTVVVMAYIEV